MLRAAQVARLSIRQIRSAYRGREALELRHATLSVAGRQIAVELIEVPELSCRGQRKTYLKCPMCLMKKLTIGIYDDKVGCRRCLNWR